MLFGQISLTGPPSPKGVDQTQALVELGISAGRLRGRAVERLERRAAGLSLRIGPHRDGVGVLNNQVDQRRRRVGRRHSPRHAAADGREGVTDAMEYKLEEGWAVRLPVGEKEARSLGPRHRAVNGRDAQAKGVSELLEREPWLEGQLQGDDYILRAELHPASIHSIFQNLEKLGCKAPVPAPHSDGKALAPACKAPQKKEASRLGRDTTRAGEGTRTLDIQLGKLALYQLSYARELFKA